jgi:hypothetical protein
VNNVTNMAPDSQTVMQPKGTPVREKQIIGRLAHVSRGVPETSRSRTYRYNATHCGLVPGPQLPRMGVSPIEGAL